ncbi:hypothetical protein CWE09_07515 [Aliidiomarina minuta]|uniref:DoxX family protein n=1 Tax=Aliidiomarina minuta TaxID=880057 RepID=A0A432W8S3_9GAMM|nr:hypothetical protein [Aliidiomarina minuta]RUO26547.1 hypothetical protein CWE09_07515 [Aliidiomarina minuta]
MITPIIMLALMMTPYLLAWGMSAASHREFNTRSAAAIGLSALFIFTGIGHFVQTEAMVQMLPSWVPMRLGLVYGSGLLEFTIALGFLISNYRRLAGWLAAAVLILFFPANIYAALNYIPMGGHEWGPVYLLIRAPLQVAILVWVYWFTIRQPTNISDLYQGNV